MFMEQFIFYAIRSIKRSICVAERCMCKSKIELLAHSLLCNLVQPSMRETPQQQPAEFLDRRLLVRFTSIDSFSRELEKVVHEHELRDHMDFNDDNTYKTLLNEVRSSAPPLCSLCLVKRT